jgi:hypothetical protein
MQSRMLFAASDILSRGGSVSRRRASIALGLAHSEAVTHPGWEVGGYFDRDAARELRRLYSPLRTGPLSVMTVPTSVQIAGPSTP